MTSMTRVPNGAPIVRTGTYRRRRPRRRGRRGPAIGVRTQPWVARELYLQSEFTRKTCAICSDEQYELHHPEYREPWQDDLAALVPLCRRHHAEFTFVIWPAVSTWYDRQRATLAYIVHGPALAEHIRLFGPLSVQALRGDPSIHGQLALEVDENRA